MSARRVRDAYAARVEEYSALFGSIDATAVPDRVAVLNWARGVEGLVLDVGCGPGQWTDYLARHGVHVEGIDLVPEFVREARRRYPDITYRVGDATDLGVPGASVGGVLAWYSLIHLDPGQIDGVLTEFARSLRPDGGLALGFFEGPELMPFDHAVTGGYIWPLGLLASHVEQAGFRVTQTSTRTDPGVRRHGMITALLAT